MLRGSPYQIFVRELVAMDGRDASEILLIDSIGENDQSSILTFSLFDVKQILIKISCTAVWIGFLKKNRMPI